MVQEPGMVSRCAKVNAFFFCLVFLFVLLFTYRVDSFMKQLIPVIEVTLFRVFWRVLLKLAPNYAVDPFYLSVTSNLQSYTFVVWMSGSRVQKYLYFV